MAEPEEELDYGDLLDGLREAGVLNEKQQAAALAVLDDRARDRDPSRGEHPRRRATDRAPGWLVGLWRNFVPLIALGLAAYAVAGIQTDVDVQRQGRGVAIDILCGFGNGVEAAGKATITTPVQPPEFRRNLEKLGLPPEAERQANAKVAGEAYARLISQNVADQAGAAAVDVVNKDGSLNCDALSKAARAGNHSG